MREVRRDASSVIALVVPRSLPPTIARLAYVRAFAERAARAEGLVALDTVDLVPRTFGPTDPALLATRFERLELRLAQPPLDGACTDPRATIEIDESDDGPSFFVRSVRLLCEKESVAGRRPPPDASRKLPATAAGKQPFLAICEYVSFAWVTSTTAS